MKKISYACSLLVLFCAHSFSKNYVEDNGFVVVEAEHFSSQHLDEKRRWFVFDSNNMSHHFADSDIVHVDDASEKAYLEILPDTRVNHEEKLIHGENFSGAAGKVAVLNYPIYFETPGRYYFWARAFSTGTEDNGIHVGLNGEWPETSKRLQLCKGKGKWTWSSAQRVEKNHCGVSHTITVDIPHAGVHNIQVSMREDGFELDQFLLTQNKNFAPEDRAYPKTVLQKKPLAPKKDLLGIKNYRLMFRATEHFDVDQQSAVNYYTHGAKSALAINAAKNENRNKFASASAIYNPKNKKEVRYNLTLVTLAETDGESEYQVSVNDKIIGEFTNPETQIDYSEVYFTVKDVMLKSGDKITVSSKAVTNGKIPENNETAYARGRWVAVVLQ